MKKILFTLATALVLMSSVAPANAQRYHRHHRRWHHHRHYRRR